MLYEKFPVQKGVKYMNQLDLERMYLENTWNANLSVTGASGLPQVQKAGNVVRPTTSLRLSLRLCPLFDAEKAV